MISAFGRPVAPNSRRLLTLAVSLGLAVCARAVGINDAVVSDAGITAASAAILDAAASGGARTVLTGDSTGSGTALNAPTLVAVAPNGTVFYYETASSSIVTVSPTGVRTVVSGGTTGTGPAFVAVSGLAWDLATSSLIASDSGSSPSNSGILSIDPVLGNRTQITGNGAGSGVALNNPQFVAVDGVGTIYYYETTAPGTADGVVSVNPSSGARTLLSGGSGPVGAGSAFVAVTGMAWDLSTQTLLVSDAGSSASNSGIIRVTPSTGNRAFVTGDGAGGGVALDIPESVTVTLGGTIYYIEEDASGAANSVVSVNPSNGSRTVLSGAGTGSGTALIAPTSVAAAVLAPQITNATLSASGTVGVVFTPYTITAADSPATFGAAGLPSGLVVNPANGQITGTPIQAGTFNVSISASNGAGTGSATLVVTINAVTLTVAPGALPASTYGAGYLQTISASGGTPPYSFQVTSGTPIPGLGLSSGGVLSGVTSVVGSFTFTVTATDSSLGQGAPFMGSQTYTVVVGQASQTINFTTISGVTQGLPYTLSATSSSGLPVSFAVQSGDATITGGTTLKILNLLPVTIVASQAGNSNYLAAPNASQTVTANRASTRLSTPTAAPASTNSLSGGSSTPSTAVTQSGAGARLVDVSIRAYVGAGVDQALYTGFVVAGSSPEQLLIRGIGPTLAQFQVDDALASPQLSLFDAAGNLIASDLGWSGTPTTGSSPIAASVQPAGSALFARLDVFALPAGSADCAVVAGLPAGQYTARLSGSDQTAGVAMAELTDAGSGASSARLINFSGRAQVGSGSNVLIAGFVVSGSGSETVLIRGIGPALGSFGITGALAAPQLTLYDSSGNAIATNIGWSNASLPGNSRVGANVQAATSSLMDGVDAFGLATGSSDSAMVVTLPPGAYTAQVSGVNSASGIGLVEVYDVPSAP